MKLRVGENGGLVSDFLAALSGRRIPLKGGKSGAHPVQTINAGWRTLALSFSHFVDDIADLQGAIDPSGDRVLATFRSVTYDATELFDSYSKLLVARIGETNPPDRRQVKDFAKAAARLRDPWAHICNRFKHHGSRALFVWAVSRADGTASARFMMVTPENGDSLLHDKTVHRGACSSVDLAKAAHELLHSLLRTDLLAARLVRSLSERDCDPQGLLKGEWQIFDSIRRLSELRVRALFNEPLMFDGVAIDSGGVLLRRLSASRVPNPAVITTRLTGDGVTRTFSAA